MADSNIRTVRPLSASLLKVLYNTRRRVLLIGMAIRTFCFRLHGNAGLYGWFFVMQTCPFTAFMLCLTESVIPERYSLHETEIVDLQ